MDSKYKDKTVGTLEIRYIYWSNVLSDSKKSDAEKQDAKKARADDLKKITMQVAEYHYQYTYRLLEKPEFKDSVRLNNQMCENLLSSNIAQLYFLMNPGASEKTTAKAELEIKINEIYKAQLNEEQKNIFYWATVEPIIFVNGNLHPRNIYYVPSAEHKERIDIESASVKTKNEDSFAFGPAIIDFSFLKSPHFACEHAFKAEIFSMYLNKIKELNDSSGLKIPNIYEMNTDWAAMKMADKTWELFWNITTAKELYEGISKGETSESDFKMHLKYTKDGFEEFIRNEGSVYPQAKMLYELLSERKIII
jgi:hypothetical protein